MKIIDGLPIAQKIERQLKIELKKLKNKPSLVIILVGRNLASEVYINKKAEICGRLEIKCRVYRLSSNTSQNKLLKLIEKLNKDNSVNGILIQLPLPPKINRNAVMYSIAPWKDVDGLNPINVGFLEVGQAFLVPPTVAAVLEMLKYTRIKLKGLRACLIGYSELVGKPLIPFLISQGVTVIICDKNTRNLFKIAQEADILVVAAGVPNLIKKSMVKKGAIVIDVGINRKGKKIVGDVDFNKVKNKTKFITSVPGGVGPITVVMLIKNLIEISKNYG